jgi:hypothetical protein
MKVAMYLQLGSILKEWFQKMEFSSASWCAKKQTLVQHCARISEEGNSEGIVFTVHIMKMYRGSRGITHLILNLGIRWGQSHLRM